MSTIDVSMKTQQTRGIVHSTNGIRFPTVLGPTVRGELINGPERLHDQSVALERSSF